MTGASTGCAKATDAANSAPAISGTTSLPFGASLRHADEPTWVNAGEVIDALGASKAVLASLVAGGVLSPRTNAPTVRACWRLSDMHALIDELRVRAIPMPSDPAGWESLQQARSRTWVAIGEIIGAVRTGEMTIAYQHDLHGYNGFRVKAAEVDNLAAGQSSSLGGTITVSSFGRMVGLRDGGHSLTLIEADHVPTITVRHPQTQEVAHRITDQSIAAFRRKFLTAATIAVEFGLHQNTIRTLLKASGIEPFKPDGRSIGSIWLRVEVEHIFKPHKGR